MSGSAARAFRKALKSPDSSMKMHDSKVSLRTNVAGYSASVEANLTTRDYGGGSWAETGPGDRMRGTEQRRLARRRCGRQARERGRTGTGSTGGKGRTRQRPRGQHLSHEYYQSLPDTKARLAIDVLGMPARFLAAPATLAYRGSLVRPAGGFNVEARLRH